MNSCEFYMRNCCLYVDEIHVYWYQLFLLRTFLNGLLYTLLSDLLSKFHICSIKWNENYILKLFNIVIFCFRAGRRRRNPLALYTEDDGHDLSDLGIGTSSTKSSLSEDCDTHSLAVSEQTLHLSTFLNNLYDLIYI